MGKKSKVRRASPKLPAPKCSLWIAGGLFVLGLLLYVNTLNHGFVFDDVTLIRQNPQVTNLEWSGILWKGGYRPVRTFTYALNYMVNGDNPRGFHVVNVVLHACNAVLLFLLLWGLTRSNLIAGAAGFLFAAHPAQTAAVAYISGRKDLLATLFLLAGFTLLVRYRRDGSKATSLAGFSIVCFLLAVLSKEVAIVFPVLLLVIDAVLRRERLKAQSNTAPSPWGSFWRVFRKNCALYCGFAVLAAGVSYWAVFINNASRMEGYWGGTVWTNLGTSFKLFAHYLKLAVFPYPLIADYTGSVFPVSTGFAEPATWAAVLVFLAFCGITFWTYTRFPLLSLGLVWFFVCLLPVLHIIPFHEIAADHFLYLPLVGACLCFGLGFSRGFASARTRGLTWGVLGAVGIFFCSQVIVRNGDWKNERSLWEATYVQAPGSYRANTNLGQIYFNEGQRSKGIELTQRSIELDPSRSVPRGNLGAMYYMEGQSRRLGGDLSEAKVFQRKAIQQFESSVEMEEKNPFALSNMGNSYKELALIYESEGEIGAVKWARAMARKYYWQALKIPDRRRELKAIWRNLGGLGLDDGEPESAVRCLTIYLKEFPDDPVAHHLIGYAYFDLGRYELAASHLETATKARPSAELFDKLGRCYEQQGKHELAIAAFLSAVRLSPESPALHYNLGLLYREAGDFKNAIRYLQQTIKLDKQGEFAGRVMSLLKSIK